MLYIKIGDIKIRNHIQSPIVLFFFFFFLTMNSFICTNNNNNNNNNKLCGRFFKWTFSYFVFLW